VRSDESFPDGDLLGRLYIIICSDASFLVGSLPGLPGVIPKRLRKNKLCLYLSMF